MADYGHDLLFGTFLTPAADQAERVVDLARLTEQSGLDLVSVQDHPYQPAFLDAWTLLSVIAASTTRVRVFPNVANLPLRPPAVLARSAASLDILSGGRAELGLGAGAFWEAIAAQGGPRRTPAESVTALEEAIRLIRALWTPGRGLRLDGEHYQVQGTKPGPFPVHDIGIWLGAIKPRMLRLTGRAGDGWLPSSSYVPPDQLPAGNQVIDEAATAAGRTPEAVRRLYNITGSFTGDGFLQGPPKVWAEQLAELTLAHGVSGYILASDSAVAIQRFAAEVAPAVRELVETARGTSPERPVSADGASGDERLPSGGGVSGERRPDEGGGGGVPGAGSAAEGVSERKAVAEQNVRSAPSFRERVFGGTARRDARGQTGPLAAPTPDDGVRLSEAPAWDESTRPTGPEPDPARAYTPHEQAAGRHLIDVHDHLRTELAQLRDLVEQVAAGSMDPGTARSRLNAMTMRQNNWTLGAYCESYCRVVTNHHLLEDQSLFPHLRRSDARLTPVIDRLEEEHHAIHEVIERVDRALVAFVTVPDGLAEVRAAVDLLTDTLLSHLSYEEHQLVEPLARLGFQ
ncbi:LLM class flavin-dependent oxidoreductase [Streptosporangium soli]|nr:LLM class flavin-dependent oxidoreductase [Streptosporangium sp. KLBMP 9127]